MSYEESDTISVHSESTNFSSDEEKKYFNESAFLNRLCEIPLVLTVWQYVRDKYVAVKGENSLFFLILDNIEDLVIYTTWPIFFIFDRQVAWIDHVLDKLLEAVQNRYPVINAPVKEQKQRLRKYYQTTLIKKRIDHARHIKKQTVKKIEETEREAEVVLNRTVTESFDQADALIDKYVAGSEKPKRHERTPPKRSVVKNLYNRTTETVFKFLRAIKNRILYIIYQVIDITLASIYLIIAGFQNAIGYSFEFVYIVASLVQQSAVGAVKKISGTVSGLSDFALENVVPFVPELVQKPLANVLMYLHYWRDRVEQTATIGDVCAVLVDETKKNLQTAQDFVIMTTYDERNPVHHRL